MGIGYVIKESTPEYFYFVLNPREVNSVTIGGILKVYINNKPYFALIENLEARTIEEEKLTDYETIDYIYGKIRKPDYLLIGKAVFIEKPEIPPLPGQEVFLPTDEEILELYSFKEEGIPIGKLNNITISAKIKELLIRHCGVFGITGSGKSTTVAHIVKELTERNIPVIIFDVHRDYIFSFDNAIIITFSEKEKENIEKKLKQIGRDCTVYVGKLDLSLLKEYPEEIIALPQRQAVRIAHILRTILSFNPRTVEKLLSWINFKFEESDPKELRNFLGKLRQNAEDLERLESLKARISKLLEWQIFRKNVMDEGEDLLDLLEKLIEKIREGKIEEKKFEYTEEGEVIPKTKTKRVNIIIFDLNPLSIEEQRILIDIVLDKIYSIYKKLKLEGKPDVLLIVIEEAHRFCSKEVKTSGKIGLIAREGRKFGLGLMLVSQIPSKIHEDIISQINTFFLLKMINPKDLEFIRKTCPYISKEYFEALTRLETGKALIVGLAVKNPAIVKIIYDVKVGGAEEEIEERIKERIQGL